MIADLQHASSRLIDALRHGAPRPVVDAAAAEVDRRDDCPNPRSPATDGSADPYREPARAGLWPGHGLDEEAATPFDSYIGDEWDGFS
jgi:hypothetical protein